MWLVPAAPTNREGLWRAHCTVSFGGLGGSGVAVRVLPGPSPPFRGSESIPPGIPYATTLASTRCSLSTRTNESLCDYPQLQELMRPKGNLIE